MSSESKADIVKNTQDLKSNNALPPSIDSKLLRMDGFGNTSSRAAVRRLSIFQGSMPKGVIASHEFLLPIKFPDLC
jgi:hypothetical protein